MKIVKVNPSMAERNHGVMPLVWRCHRCRVECCSDPGAYHAAFAKLLDRAARFAPRQAYADLSRPAFGQDSYLCAECAKKLDCFI